MSKQYLIAVLTFVLAVFPSCSNLDSESKPNVNVEPNPNLNIDEQKLFLGGFDVVSYHNANQPVKGSPQHSAEHQGATFHFASQANQKAFQKSPDRYLPKYGGYCAFGVANGKAGVPANPHTFKVRDGELLMFFNDLYEGKPFNTKVPWDADEVELYSKAEANWPNLKK